MSEFHVLELSFKDQECLVEVLKELGYKPKVVQKAESLYGYQGDARSQKANIIIPKSQVGSSSNDIGFERTSDGYKMHISEYDIGSHRFPTNKLKQMYAEKKIMKEVRKDHRFRLKNKTTKNGNIVLNMVRTSFCCC